MTPAAAPAPALTADELRDLGHTDGSGATLARLAAGQHTRRLLLMRVLLDAIDELDAEGAGTRLGAALAHDHAGLLEATERAAPAAARRVLFYPLTGPWAERCVQWLGTGSHPGNGPGAARDLAHLGSLAVAAAARSGVGFATRVPVHGGRITLPTLGALCCQDPDGSVVDVAGGGDAFTIRAGAGARAEVRRDATGAWRSRDPRWLPLHTLDGGPRPVLLDDLDPGPFTGGDRRALPPEERARWSALWHEALPLLGLGGAARSAELALLDCIVPTLDPAAAPTGGPPPSGPQTSGAHTSGTTPTAFGAVMASTPPGPAQLAAGLAHELQHAKLAAVSELNPLHTAGPERRHWAPWRPEPRPFHALLHGTYAHLALAGFWQRLAIALDDPAGRDRAWAGHARCLTQVGAVLPTLAGARGLTDAGRVFVGAMAERHARLRDPAPPDGHLVRAAAYVETARTEWLRRHPR
ncbi:aKG-HExxH-type peptide beta-hydroxylase [Streptomyces radicis]|uniref:HEXXH motif domain-containing protein n=1 Tax=Streptomyces radicis TaxID=1750517 RepID=A0A3A9WAR8_9ACTN|nr:HEXXH motif-containing putative peptide modification protein [Streptomyces radicis]RKN06484.1 HEXXH motif domain-containing protein [Streptomyces radicis]RKN20257.1 HEXXH motif domain-containing protein [Streptomyces radicis]